MVRGSALWGLTLPSLVFVPALAWSSVVDDFSGANLNFDNWRFYDDSVDVYERVRVVDPKAGRVHLGVAAEGGQGIRRSTLTPVATDREALEATLAVDDLVVGDNEDDFSALRVEGSYYNAEGTEATSEDLTGDVFAYVALGDFGEGVRGWWGILQSENADFSNFQVIEVGGFSGAEFESGASYPARLAYDGDRTFEFSLNGATTIIEGPPRAGDAGAPFHRFNAVTQAESGVGRVRGTVSGPIVDDDVVSYDNFEETALEPLLWAEPVRARGTVDGRLQLGVQGNDLDADYMDRRQEGLYLKGIDNPEFMEVDVSISSASALDTGVLAMGGLTGYVYNARRDGGDQAMAYDGADGDVWASVRLALHGDGTMGAVARVETSLSDFSTDGSPLLEQSFTEPLELDTEYTLSIERREDEIVLGLNDETIIHEVETPMYEPSPTALNGYRRLLAQVSGVPSGGGGSGVAFATFDNVSTAPSAGAEDDDGQPGGSGETGASGSGSSSGGCSVLGHGGGAEVPFVAVLLMLLWRASRRAGRLW